MATRYTGTREERLARLDHAHRRCDGNSRRCIKSASMAYDMYPAVRGVPVPGAPLIRKQACSAHRRQFGECENYFVVGSLALNNQRPPGKDHPFTIFHHEPADV